MLRDTTADEALKQAMIGINSLPMSHRQRKEAGWSALSKNVLHDDLGYYSDSADTNAIYNLSDETRDRLIAHSRQDAAMVYSQCTDIYHNANEANKWSQWALVFAFVSMCLSGYIAYAVS